MSDTSKDIGIIVALAERFETQRLPRLLDIKKKVDQGGLLDDSDIAFLEEAVNTSQQVKALADKHPEWQDIVTKATSLYREITEKALENQKAQSE